MSYIGATPAESYASFYVQHFTTSATTSYALDYPVVNENDLRLVINNVVQQPGSGKAYTAAASTLTLSAATTTSDTMYTVFLGRALQTVNPPADSVGGTQLADSAISGQGALGAEPADTDEFLVSDAGTLKRMDYSYIKAGAAGKIGQVVQTYLTASQTTTSTSMVDITGFNVAITPGAASSKILVMISLGQGFTAGHGGSFDLMVDIDSAGYASVGMGDAEGLRKRAIMDGHGVYLDTALRLSANFLHSPSYTLTDVITYKMQWYTESATNVLNQCGGQSNSANFTTSASGITVMEVLA